MSKNIIITGANRGLGHDISKLLFNNGLNVISLSRKKPDIECEHYYCDLSDDISIENCVEQVLSKYNKIDCFINNAAVFLEKPLIDTSSKESDYIFKVNLQSPIKLIQSFVPLMINNSHGRIFNISSTAALYGKKEQSVYCSSKHALLGLFRSLSLELKSKNIHIHNICMGGMNTDFTKGHEIYNQLKNQNLIDTKDIADMIWFILNQSTDLEISEIEINRFRKN